MKLRRASLPTCKLLRASRVVGTGALHQSLHGSCHRSSGTDLSSGIVAAPPVIAASTLASTTLSVYERVAQTTLVRQKVFTNHPQVIADVCNAKGALATYQ